MTIEELLFNYNFEEGSYPEDPNKLHPIYDKHLPLTWVLQSIWGHVHCGNLSLSKARELSACAIEKHLNDEL